MEVKGAPGERGDYFQLWRRGSQLDSRKEKHANEMESQEDDDDF